MNLNEKVQTEYKRAKNHIKKSYISLQNKGAIMPERKNLENLPPTIDSLIMQHGALLDTIIVENAPNKTAYIEGEILDLSGLKVLAVYDNGATRDITNIVTCTPDNGSVIKLTDVSIEIELNEGNKIVKTSQSITVAKYVPILQYIEVTDPPKKSIYLDGNTLDLSGMVVTATYGRGEKVDVTKLCVMTPAANSKLTVDDNKILITYTENGIVKSTQIAITVELSIRKLTSITIESQPTKLSYYTGEYFDTEGLKVVASFEDGTTEDVSSYCSFTPAYIESVDTTEVVISYSENGYTQTASIQVQVTENVIENIAIAEYPQTEYFVGQTFDTEGLKVVANYTSGKQEDVTSECTISKSESLDTEDKSITISYLNFNVELLINVSKVEMTSISVTKVPNKIIYFEGENVDVTGIEVTANFNNGATMIISEGFTYTPEILGVNDSKVTVTYQGLSCTYSVTVLEPVINKIEITTPPNKTAYFNGEIIDLTGIKVTGTYTDGSTEDITNKCTFTPTTALNTNDTEIVAHYNEFSDTTPITVVNFAPVSLLISQQPSKVNYMLGDNLDVTGLIVKVSFNDGTSTQLLNGDGVTITPTENLQITDTEVSVSYTLNGITVSSTFAIQVVEADVILANNSWTKIAEVSASGEASKFWKIGDIKSATIDGVSYDFRIIGFNHDTIAGTSQKAGITFEMVGYSNSTYKFHTSSTPSGLPSYASSQIATSTLVNLFEKVESELKANIKEVKKDIYNVKNSALTSMNAKLFILSLVEYNKKAVNEGEGSTYEYYLSGNEAHRSVRIWTRSLRKFTSSLVYVRTIGTTGVLSDSEAQNNSYNMSIAFCI